jgi:indole-3-glycerol phosphate synthase
MTILDQIIANKRVEVEQRKAEVPLIHLGHRPFFDLPVISLKNKLKEGPGIISEFKRRSPSKGLIREGAEITAIMPAYEQAGAAAGSILTDEVYFGGSDQDILDARPLVKIPILRKDFIIDPYQIMEAKSLGADLILLIAECLSRQEIMEFTQRAHDLGLEVLMELHFREELEKWNPFIDLLGVNNRNLKTFETGIQKSIDLASLLPTESIWVSESGLQGAEELNTLVGLGYRGFLIGEHFMKSPEPGEMCKAFVDSIKNKPDNAARS